MQDERDDDDPIRASGMNCVGCSYNLTGVAVGSRCPECGTPIEDSILAFADEERVRHPRRLKKLSYVLPVFVTLLFLGGILAIVYTAKANTAAEVGDQLAYQRALETRLGWVVISGGIGALFLVLMAFTL